MIACYQWPFDEEGKILLWHDDSITLPTLKYFYDTTQSVTNGISKKRENGRERK